MWHAWGEKRNKYWILVEKPEIKWLSDWWLLKKGSSAPWSYLVCPNIPSTL
jgi:hypothetical protein